jgi:hypothetical protein
MTRSGLVTVTDAAALTGRTPAAVRQWIARGLLTPAGVHGGRNWLLITDVWDVERDTRRRSTRMKRSTPRGALDADAATMSQSR